MTHQRSVNFAERFNARYLKVEQKNSGALRLLGLTALLFSSLGSILISRMKPFFIGGTCATFRFAVCIRTEDDPGQACARLFLDQLNVLRWKTRRPQPYTPLHNPQSCGVCGIIRKATPAFHHILGLEYSIVCHSSCQFGRS